MEITVIAFGQLAEITGGSFLIHDINDTDGLSAYIRSSFPATGNIPYKIAINKKIISVNTLIDNQTTIALLPPFSGG
jgi:molybdopterin synthase sulfur carrier subunit